MLMGLLQEDGVHVHGTGVHVCGADVGVHRGWCARAGGLL